MILMRSACWKRADDIMVKRKAYQRQPHWDDAESIQCCREQQAYLLELGIPASDHDGLWRSWQ